MRLVVLSSVGTYGEFFSRSLIGLYFFSEFVDGHGFFNQTPTDGFVVCLWAGHVKCMTLTGLCVYVYTCDG